MTVSDAKSRRLPVLCLEKSWWCLSNTFAALELEQQIQAMRFQRQRQFDLGVVGHMARPSMKTGQADIVQNGKRSGDLLVVI